MLPLAVDRFWDEKSLAASHSHRFGYFVCSTALRPLTFKWGNYLFVLDCTMLYLNILIYTCIQLYFSILNKICDMRVTSPGCFDMECLVGQWSNQEKYSILRDINSESKICKWYKVCMTKLIYLFYSLFIYLINH